MSPGHAPAHGAGQLRPVAAPATVNSWLRLLVGTSDSHTLPVYPTPQASESPVGVHERITSPGAFGVQPRGVPLAYSPSVVRAFGSNPGALARLAVEAAPAPPPVSAIDQSIDALPVLLSVSVLDLVWFGGTMNVNELGETSPLAVRRLKFRPIVSPSSSSVTLADSVL